MNEIKHFLSNKPILKLPDCNHIFIVRTDATNTGLGRSLLQQYDGIRHPVIYASKKLLPHETRYSVIEFDCLAIVWAFSKYLNYLYGSEFILEVDHQPLLYLQSTQYQNTRIMRWNLLLQSYKFVVNNVKGKDNLTVDYLSHIDQPQF